MRVQQRQGQGAASFLTIKCTFLILNMHLRAGSLTGMVAAPLQQNKNTTNKEPTLQPYKKINKTPFS
jgi:hypothetical protein